MNRRSLITAISFAVALLSAPALAKDKVPVAPPALSAVVDPDPSHDPDNVLLLDLSNGGRVTIRLMPAWAPAHVERIKTLARAGFYNGIIFHRVIEGFMAQTGDPTGTGEGGSQLPDLKAEFNSIPHVRGSVSMARTDKPDSANSQFFIVFYPRFALDRKYTNFGRVIGGMQYVDTVVRGEPPQNPTKIFQASLASDGKPQATTVQPGMPAPVAPPAAPPPSLTAEPAPAPATPAVEAPAAPVPAPVETSPVPQPEPVPVPVPAPVEAAPAPASAPAPAPAPAG